MTTTTDQTSAEQMLDQLDPTTDPMRNGRNLRRVGAALTRLEQAEQELRAAVSAAHEAGDSWAAIGLVLGTSRQAAHRKYSTTGADAAVWQE